MTADHPHANSPVLTTGAPIDAAHRAVILIHGRGASAQDILRLAAGIATFQEPLEGTAWVAPEAIGHTWYPYRYLEPLERNQPFLDSALTRIDEVIDACGQHGVPVANIALVGFSQGACLALEYVARQRRSIRAVAALAGGLIGPPDAKRMAIPDLTGADVFIGVGDRDEHIAVADVERGAAALTAAGATVEQRVYPGLNHTIVDDELTATRELLLRTLPRG